MVLALESLSSGYGGVPIVREVSLALRPGEVVGVFGRNGVGKTTLVKTIAGLVRATSGRIRMKDDDVTNRGAQEMARRGMGYVPQGRGIFGRLTVLENLRMGEMIGGDGRNYEAVFDWFPRLKERARQRAGTLSGGEQQMLAIGRVLIGKPTFLLLDEPSEGIQPSVVQQIAEVLVHQNETHSLAILLVEQNLDLVYMTAERCVVMDKGAFVAALSPEELAQPEVARHYLAI
jgi:ABC-type branched-subunit amino acid transport system ATPase component